MTAADVGYLIAGAFLIGCTFGFVGYWWITRPQPWEHLECDERIKGAENLADFWEAEYNAAVREKAAAVQDREAIAKAYGYVSAKLITAQHDAEQYEAAWRAEQADHEATRAQGSNVVRIQRRLGGAS